MSKEMSVILLGVAVVIVPYLGVPSSWRTLLLVAAGVVLIVIGFLLRAQGLSHSEKHSPHRPFVENGGASAHPHTAPPQATIIASDILHEQKEGITSLN